jgi:hypothetical protein
MLAALTITLACAVPSVPPGHEVVNHAHPGHYAQPTVRVFERRAEDASRERAWHDYCRELDQHWAAYRAAGSTPEAWRAYLSAAGQAKRRYVFADPYLLPIVTE